MLNTIQAHVDAALDHAPILTFGSASTTFLFWGLHVSEIGIIVSSFAAVCGVILQTYMVMRSARNEKMRQIEVAAETVRVAAALAKEMARLAASLARDTRSTAADLKTDTAKIAAALKDGSGGTL